MLRGADLQDAKLRAVEYGRAVAETARNRRNRRNRRRGALYGVRGALPVS